MSQKNSNKYLFDQTVKCKNCKWYETKIAENEWNICTYFRKVSDQNLEIDVVSVLDNVDIARAYFCGPIGAFYEPKSNK